MQSFVQPERMILRLITECYGEPATAQEASVKARAGIRLIAFLLAACLYPLQAQSPQAPVAATSVAGSDIGDRINHALKACTLQCTVYIPPGNYSFSVDDTPGAESRLANTS